MTRTWDQVAEDWILVMRAGGDWARRHVLDPAMLGYVRRGQFKHALDVGCGEGRFCRMLRAEGIAVTGIDLSAPLIEEACRQDPDGAYVVGNAEDLAFDDDSFDLVIAYLSLVDIPDFRAAIAEMARVLAPGGHLLVANLTSMNSAATGDGWVYDAAGNRHHFGFDHYMDERAVEVPLHCGTVVNYHRPLSAYMQAYLGAGLRLTEYQEPQPVGDCEECADAYRRVSYFNILGWIKDEEHGHVPRQA